MLWFPHNCFHQSCASPKSCITSILWITFILCITSIVNIPRWIKHLLPHNQFFKHMRSLLSSTTLTYKEKYGAPQQEQLYWDHAANPTSTYNATLALWFRLIEKLQKQACQIYSHATTEATSYGESCDQLLTYQQCIDYKCSLSSPSFCSCCT